MYAVGETTYSRPLRPARHARPASGGRQQLAMSEKNPIKLFVTHLFEPDEEYFRVFEYLESAPNFFYTNLSAPEKPPRSRDPASLQIALREQMEEAEAVLLLSKLHARAPSLIEFQAVCARKVGKPVIVMEPFGEDKSVVERLRKLGDCVVGWNQRDMSDAIKLQARHEETARFDMVEFDPD